MCFDILVFGNWIQHAFVYVPLKLQSNNFQLKVSNYILWFIAEATSTTANIWEWRSRKRPAFDLFVQQGCRIDTENGC